MFWEWTQSKLEAIKDCNRVLVRDPLNLLRDLDGSISKFARENSFTVIIAWTNLVFRELYEQAVASEETPKLLVIDKTPARRRAHTSVMKAPPAFYPDMLAETSEECRINLDLKHFLIETTGDPNWPPEANELGFARLIANHLDAVLRAHKNLMNTHSERFTDHDFKKIVAFASLGVPEAAFKRLGAQDYWKIGLLGHEALEELESLAPEVTKPILDELRKAPSPFCHFADYDAETVIRAFYLSVILAQHTDLWSLVLAAVEPSLAKLANIETKTLRESTPKLLAMDSQRANKDLEFVESSLSRDALSSILLDHIKLSEPGNFAAVIEKEHYSTLFRSLALLLAMDDILATQSTQDVHSRITKSLFTKGTSCETSFVDSRPSLAWSNLKEGYRLATTIRSIRAELDNSVKNLKVAKSSTLSFKSFCDLWNVRRINRLEYYLSALERLVHSVEMLPRPEEELPSAFGNALGRIRERIRCLTEETLRQLDAMNSLFQRMTVAQYPSWVAKDSEVRLTSQFIRRCLKPNWDPQTEKAVVFIFDGMRYEIWDELLRPLLEDRMDVLQDMPACSLLPSETDISRKAITAGTYPDEFDISSSEDKLLRDGLSREFAYAGDVKVVTPQSTGTGEVVRYRAGNLDVYIFELCDKELHKVNIKTLPNGREVPSRPLSFIYQQLLKNVIDTEVMAIIRKLTSGTKVFITADHGFGRVGREPVWFDESYFNEVSDCAYTNCWLRVHIDQIQLPPKFRDNIIVFSPEQLRMPKQEKRVLKKTAKVLHKEYKCIVFPKVGFSFSRQGSHYNPDAYSHGGISMGEMIVPMAVLRVRDKDEGLLILDDIVGPSEILEGQNAEFRLSLRRGAKSLSTKGEIRVEVHASYAREPERDQLPRQVVYLTTQPKEITYSLQLNVEDATDEERREGAMERDLTIGVTYNDGQRNIRRSRMHHFVIRLNSERVIRRVPPKLGNILGLTPKSMR